MLTKLSSFLHPLFYYTNSEGGRCLFHYDTEGTVLELATLPGRATQKYLHYLFTPFLFQSSILHNTQPVPSPIIYAAIITALTTSVPLGTRPLEIKYDFRSVWLRNGMLSIISADKVMIIFLNAVNPF